MQRELLRSQAPRHSACFLCGTSSDAVERYDGEDDNGHSSTEPRRIMPRTQTVVHSRQCVFAPCCDINIYVI